MNYSQLIVFIKVIGCLGKPIPIMPECFQLLLYWVDHILPKLALGEAGQNHMWISTSRYCPANLGRQVFCLHFMHVCVNILCVCGRVMRVCV